MSLTGLQFRIRYKIISKLKEAGATSKENAVTVQEAGLDSREQNWLTYLAGAFLDKIKKTKDQRYYI